MKSHCPKYYLYTDVPQMFISNSGFSFELCSSYRCDACTWISVRHSEFKLPLLSLLISIGDNCILAVALAINLGMSLIHQQPYLIWYQVLSPLPPNISRIGHFPSSLLLSLYLKARLGNSSSFLTTSLLTLLPFNRSSRPSSKRIW